VLAYALARPAREALFTVISREEKYKAKFVMDTVVQASIRLASARICWSSPSLEAFHVGWHRKPSAGSLV
jgi:AAA family ATP:ADP antiporter